MAVLLVSIELLGYTVSVWMVISKEFSGGPLFYQGIQLWMDFAPLCLPVSVRESKKECVV